MAVVLLLLVAQKDVRDLLYQTKEITKADM